MAPPLKVQHWEMQSDQLTSTPLKKASFLSDDSFPKSSMIDKDKMRRSPTSKDEFWDALSSNYDYLMDDGLIATCREASSDLSLDDENEIPESCCWNFTRFIEQFKSLHDLLHHLQVAKEESKSECDPNILKEQQNIAYLCKLFNEQAQKISKRYPDMRDEVHRHLNLLNNKWEAVEQSLNPNKALPSKDGPFDEITNRMRFLRKCLRDLENHLCSIIEDGNWSLEDLEDKIKEQQILQKEIEAKGKYVSSLLKLCQQLHGNIRFGQNSLPMWDAERVRRVANNLEHRWHSIWLRSLECHCQLEECMQSYKTGNIDKLEKSYSEEPVKKHPRLSDQFEDTLLMDNGLKSRMNYKPDEMDTTPQQQSLTSDGSSAMNVKDEFTPKNDKAVMVGDTGITKLKSECSGNIGKFEIVQDIGYSSETSAHFSNDEKLEVADSCGFRSSRNMQMVDRNTNGCAMASDSQFTTGLPITPSEQSPKIYLAPDKYPSIPQKHWKSLIEDKPLYSVKYNDSKTIQNDYYTVTSIDPEMLEEAPVTTGSDNICGSPQIAKEQSNFNAAIEQKKTQNLSKVFDLVDKATVPLSSKYYSSSVKEKLSNSCSMKSNNMPNNSHSPSNTLQKRGKRKSIQNCSPKVLQIGLNENWKRSARVREWLSTCQSGEDLTSDDNIEPQEKNKNNWLRKNIIDSSCDASGEYTTESDSEKSGASDDVNNSVSFSQSFTGSIETVVPAVLEENAVVQNDRAGSAEPSPCVRMRKKKRVSRDRPWSVTEVRQATVTRPSIPHSTSESALETLSRESRKNSCAKKLCLENKKPSLPDISTLSCPSVISPNADQLVPSKVIVRSSSGSEKRSPSKRYSSVSDKSSDMNEATLCATSEKSSNCSFHEKRSMNESLKTLAGGDHMRVADICKVEDDLNISHRSCIESPSSMTSEMNGSANNAEDHGSVSDPAWDEYQDPPYLSEPYSEQTADEDEVKRLINFGDDYTAILGSYSDTSSINGRKALLKGRRRSHSRTSLKKKKKCEGEIFRSDSDSEDLQNILKTSHKALEFVSDTIKENTLKFTELSSEFAELVATCQANLQHLHEIQDELNTECELESFSKEDITALQDLIQKWEVLQVKLSPTEIDIKKKPVAIDLEAVEKDVRISLAALKEKLSNLELSAMKTETVALSIEVLDNTIQNLQSGLASLQELKDPVLSLSAKIIRLKSEGGGSPITLLHNEAHKLYQQWEDVYELNCSQLTKMQTLRSKWHQSTEEKVETETETAIQWKPVQVGGTLPKTEVTKEAHHPSAAAEIQIADLHDILLDIEKEAAVTTIQCNIIDSRLEKSVLTDTPKLMKTISLKNKEASQNNCLLAPRKPTRSRLWRMLRAAIPIQFAMVVLYCVSCLMEPQCCENLNNYDFSYFPHLRYTRGPPPV